MPGPGAAYRYAMPGAWPVGVGAATVSVTTMTTQTHEAEPETPPTQPMAPQAAPPILLNPTQTAPASPAQLAPASIHGQPITLLLRGTPQPLPAQPGQPAFPMPTRMPPAPVTPPGK
jgi:hypothetical protein